MYWHHRLLVVLEYGLHRFVLHHMLPFSRSCTIPYHANLDAHSSASNT